MKILHKIAEESIDKLQGDKDAIQLDNKFWPVDSFGYARYNLALAVVDLKIAFWRAVWH